MLKSDDRVVRSGIGSVCVFVIRLCIRSTYSHVQDTVACISRSSVLLRLRPVSSSPECQIGEPLRSSKIATHEPQFSNKGIRLRGRLSDWIWSASRDKRVLMKTPTNPDVPLCRRLYHCPNASRAPPFPTSEHFESPSLSPSPTSSGGSSFVEPTLQYLLSPPPTNKHQMAEHPVRAR